LVSLASATLKTESGFLRRLGQNLAVWGRGNLAVADLVGKPLGDHTDLVTPRNVHVLSPPSLAKRGISPVRKPVTRRPAVKSFTAFKVVPPSITGERVLYFPGERQVVELRLRVGLRPQADLACLGEGGSPWPPATFLPS